MKFWKILGLLVIFYTISVNFTIATENIRLPIKDFSHAKKLMKKVYYDHQISFYCGCSYDYKQINGKEKTVIDASSCGYIPRKNTERGKFIEWEHLVPTHAFAGNLPCWRKELCEDSRGKRFKGRKCCEKIDPIFRAMEAAMHNLQPAIGELNADRSNYRYGIIPGEERVYGLCDFEVKNKTTEPREEIRGDIVRTYFYMEQKYGVVISDKQRKLFNLWNIADPADQWEKERNTRIYFIQGNFNNFIK